MKNQLRGISLALLGIIWMMFSMLDPWIPILGDALSVLSPFIGLLCGIIGVIIAFINEN